MTHISLGEADSLGIVRVCIYYSDGDVQAYTGGKACHKVQGVWMFNTICLDDQQCKFPGVLLKMVMSPHTIVRLICLASTAPA